MSPLSSRDLARLRRLVELQRTGLSREEELERLRLDNGLFGQHGHIAPKPSGSEGLPCRVPWDQDSCRSRRC